MYIKKFPVIRNSKNYLIEISHLGDRPIWNVSIKEKHMIAFKSLHSEAFLRSEICGIEDDDDFLIKLANMTFVKYENKLRHDEKCKSQENVFNKWDGRF